MTSARTVQTSRACACTDVQREYGHHYSCIYGPLRDVQGLRLQGVYPRDFPATRLLFVGKVVSRHHWQLFRVLR